MAQQRTRTTQLTELRDQRQAALDAAKAEGQSAEVVEALTELLIDTERALKKDGNDDVFRQVSLVLRGTTESGGGTFRLVRIPHLTRAQLEQLRRKLPSVFAVDVSDLPTSTGLRRSWTDNACRSSPNVKLVPAGDCQVLALISGGRAVLPTQKQVENLAKTSDATKQSAITDSINSKAMKHAVPWLKKQRLGDPQELALAPITAGKEALKLDGVVAAKEHALIVHTRHFITVSAVYQLITTIAALRQLQQDDPQSLPQLTCLELSGALYGAWLPGSIADMTLLEQLCEKYDLRIWQRAYTAAGRETWELACGSMWVARPSPVSSTRKPPVSSAPAASTRNRGRTTVSRRKSTSAGVMNNQQAAAAASSTNQSEVSNAVSVDASHNEAVCLESTGTSAAASLESASESTTVPMGSASDVAAVAREFPNADYAQAPTEQQQQQVCNAIRPNIGGALDVQGKAAGLVVRQGVSTAAASASTSMSAVGRIYSGSRSSHQLISLQLHTRGPGLPRLCPAVSLARHLPTMPQLHRNWLRPASSRGSTAHRVSLR